MSATDRGRGSRHIAGPAFRQDCRRTQRGNHRCRDRGAGGFSCYGVCVSNILAKQHVPAVRAR